jgi:hypothetical protein
MRPLGHLVTELHHFPLLAMALEGTFRARRLSGIFQMPQNRPRNDGGHDQAKKNPEEFFAHHFLQHP